MTGPKAHDGLLRWPSAIPVALVVAAVAAYANSFSASFIFDDYSLVIGDMRLRQLLTAISASTRPLTRLTFYLNYYLAGAFKAADMRAVNLVIHVAAGLLLFGLVRRTFRSPALASRFGAAADALAGTVSAIWLVHPLQTESVTYVMQRAESLMGMLYLLTLYFVARGFREPVDHRWYTAAIASSALCMASKPVAVTLPLAVLLYDRAFIAGSLKEIFRRRWSLHLGIAATWLVLITILMKPNESDTSTGLGSSLPTPLRYFWTQQQVVLHYLRLALWPRGLCLDYAWPPVASWYEAAAPGAILFALFVPAAWLLARNRPAGFAAMWFFINLAPTSSFLPIADCAFEHRMYLPLAGLVALVVGVAYGWLRPRARVASIAGLAVVVVFVLAVLTMRRNTDYESELSMWSDVVAKRPDNLRARNDLAIALSMAGEFSEAIRQYEAVLARIPADVRRRLDAGEVVERGLVAADSPSYHYFRAHINLGWLLFREFARPDAAVTHLVAALRVIPYHEQGRNMLGQVLQSQGVPAAGVDADIQRRLQDAGLKPREEAPR